MEHWHSHRHEHHRHDGTHGQRGKQQKHRHHRDSASIFKEKSLNWLERQKLVERYLKIAMIIIAIIMAIAVIVVYKVL